MAFRRPVKGEKGKPRKPISGLPGKTDRPKTALKTKPSPPQTVRDAKRVIRERNAEMRRRTEFVTAIGGK